MALVWGTRGLNVMDGRLRHSAPTAPDYLDAFVLACRQTQGKVFSSADHLFDKTNRQQAWNMERKRVLGPGSRRVRLGESIAQAVARRRR